MTTTMTAYDPLEKRQNEGMDQKDQMNDTAIKAEIDDIAERINRIIQKVEELNPESKAGSGPGSEQRAE